MMLFNLAAVALAVFTTQTAPAPAPAQEPATTPAQGITDTRASATEESNKKVCKSVQVLGTRIPQRVCHTQTEWDQMARENAEAIRSAHNNSSTCGDGSFC